MAIRKPRGYSVNRPPFVEVCEGARPNIQALVLEAWTGLPIVRLDDHHNDPIVLDAGTIVGVATGTMGSTSIEGTLMPAAWSSGISGSYSSSAWTMRFASTDTTWGFPGADKTDVNIGNVKPIGVVFQPIYSFYLQQYFTNYKRTESVGVVTDYVIQIPAITDDEHAIRAGDIVCVAPGQFDYGLSGSVTLNKLAGRFQRRAQILVDLAGGHRAGAALLNVPSGAQVQHAAELDEFIVGRCLKSFKFATGTASTKFQTDSNNGATTVTAAAKNEFVGLDKVQTVPGMALAGSGTGGVPGHLLGGYADSSGNYRALTILVRL